MYRLVEFGKREGLTITLAYYPPYHSKYNPVERCWGILEQHWNGDILDCLETVRKFAQSMSWKGKFPEVAVIDKLYQAGVRLTSEAMAAVEGFLVRLPNLPNWFVKIPCPALDLST